MTDGKVILRSEKFNYLESWFIVGVTNNMTVAALVNVLSFSHPHVRSLFSEGLWGFPDDKLGVNRRKWELLEIGSSVLLYGEYKGVKGVWLLSEVVEKFENRNPVDYWSINPTGYPWQVRLKSLFPITKFDAKLLNSVKPVKREELAALGVNALKAKADRWSLFIFSDRKGRLITYSYDLFQRIVDELEIRNKRIIMKKPDHDQVKEIIYQIGVIQNRFPKKEYKIDNKFLDVVWRRTQRSVPAVAFEIQIGGNLFEALTKLKHAFDLWNSIPVLVTTKEQIKQAKNWVEGSFHELKDVFRVLTVEEIKEYYDIKKKAKDFETKLGLI